jgi:hypothetical protein
MNPAQKMSGFKFLSVFRSLLIGLSLSGSGSEAAPTYSNHFCSNSTFFTANSNYQSNLDFVLSSLSSYATRATGFSTAKAGEYGPDGWVYGLFLCSGVVSTTVCQDCVANATKEILGRCPLHKEAIIWYDECFLHYSNNTVFYTMSEEPRVYMGSSQSILEAEKDGFNKLLANTMNSLATLASNSSTGKRFATGKDKFNSTSQTLYSLVQCTPDLNVSDCYRCFQSAIGALPMCCDGKQGGRVLLPSCNIRYELYPFYNSTSTSPAFSPLPPGMITPSICCKNWLFFQICDF